jgi:hypothetical protein
MPTHKIPKPKESNVHKAVVTYLKFAYPHVIFHTDFAAGCKMTMGQAIKNAGLQSGKSWPDLFIAEPRNGDAGLFVEIKRSIDEVFKKDGSLKAGEHIEAQAAMIGKLKQKGYHAAFGCGFDHCKSIIDNYLKVATL